MSDTSDSEGAADQGVEMPLDEQIQNARHFPPYPYRITRATLYSSYMNILLVFLPIGIVGRALNWADPTVFILNLLAVIPLASLIAFSTRELSGGIGDLFGRVLKATLSNFFEIIVGVIAVSRGEIVIAQSSLLGSMLFDSLPILGSSVFFAGIGVESVKFSKTLTNIMSSLVLVAAVSLIVPTTISPVLLPSSTLKSYMENDILVLSRCTAVILLTLFGTYSFFQLTTHTFLFLFLDPRHDESSLSLNRRASTISEEGHTPTLNPWAAAGVLLASTLSMTLCINYLIDTADGVVKSPSIGISKIFIGTILIPTAGNIGKCAALVVISLKKRIDFAIRTTLNSVLQISLFITPSLVLLGWILKQPMMLNFDIFETAVFFLAIIVVSYVVQDGTSNYFEGIMLIGTYIIIVVAFYVRSDPSETIIALNP